MNKLNSAEVPIMIGDSERMLKPTLRALSMISSQYGGLSKVRELLVAQDFAAIVFVARYGLNLSDRDARTLPEDIYATGLTADLVVPLIRYVGILANGGRPLPDEPDEGGDAPAATEGNA